MLLAVSHGRVYFISACINPSCIHAPSVFITVLMILFYKIERILLKNPLEFILVVYNYPPQTQWSGAYLINDNNQRNAFMYGVPLIG